MFHIADNEFNHPACKGKVKRCKVWSVPGSWDVDAGAFQQPWYIHKQEVQISPSKNNQTSKLIHWEKMQNIGVSYESQVVYHGMQSD